jgi:hypothetical protein
MILNLTKGLVSPQYHEVYDDNFTKVDSLRLGTVPTHWPKLYYTRRDLVTDESEWTAEQLNQGTIHWLNFYLDSTQTIVNILFPSEFLPPQKRE